VGVSSGNPTYFYKKFVLTEGFTLMLGSSRSQDAYYKPDKNGSLEDEFQAAG
jgi:hypothetical protein